MDELRMAWRNVWRNPRRSVVTIAATSFALAVMILYQGLMTGYLSGIRRNLLDLEVGDAQAFADGFRDKPSLYLVIDDSTSLVTDLRAAGFRVAPRLLGTGLGAGQESSVGVRLIGIEVEADAGVSKISHEVAQGRWLAPDDDVGVVVGWRVAENLQLGVGDELVVLSQGADGSMANDVYPVRGILRAISDGIDRGGVFMTQAAFRELMVLPGGVHQLILRLPPGAELEAGTAQAASIAPKGVVVASWKSLQPALASMLESAEGAMQVMSFIVYFAVGIVILNAMLMAVFERIRELGVLKALGYPPLGIVRLIYLETAIQTAVAVAVGVAVAIPIHVYLTRVGLDLSALGNISVMGVAWDPIWRSEVSPRTFGVPVLSLLVIVTLAVLYPALRAAWIRPLEALRD